MAGRVDGLGKMGLKKCYGIWVIYKQFFFLAKDVNAWHIEGKKCAKQ
jgi:hypothetical protein